MDLNLTKIKHVCDIYNLSPRAEIKADQSFLMRLKKNSSRRRQFVTNLRYSDFDLSVFENNTKRINTFDKRKLKQLMRNPRFDHEMTPSEFQKYLKV